MTTDCFECKHFIQELDTNYQACGKEEKEGIEIKDEWWEGKEDCPHFESIEPDWDYLYESERERKECA